jgi:hypothetical protein
MGESKSDVLQGTLDLMVLKTLEAMGPLHGYGIARRIEQVSGNGLSMNQGTIYPALLRLQQRGWIKAEWGTHRRNHGALSCALQLGAAYGFDTDYLEPLRGAVRSPQAGRRP